jgi:hypothetical protein
MDKLEETTYFFGFCTINTLLCHMTDAILIPERRALLVCDL